MSLQGQGAEVRQRRILTIAILAIVDVVLVVALVVLLMGSGGQAGDPEEGATEPTPTASAPAAERTATPEPDPTTAPDAEAFQLPSGNIWCELGSESATCFIASFDYDPPESEGCQGTTGHVVQLTASGAFAPCWTQGEVGAAPEGTDTLDYGESVTAGDLTCTSETDGLRCTNGSDGSFHVARATLTLG